MTSKEITKVIFNNGEISALYYGDVLAWKKENTEEYGVNTFAGKFTDDSTESDWFWKPNNNKISIADKVDPTTKEFNFDYKLTYYKPTLASVDKIEKIYHFPDTSNVTSMNNMFKICKALTSIDLSNFNTSSVTDMSSMFSECYALTTIDLSSFDTSKVTNMSSMFNYCGKLTSLDLSSFDTSNVTSMSCMFSDCYALTTIDLTSFDTSKVTDMYYMFGHCKALTTLDLTSFDTSNVTSMYHMFYNCNKLTTVTGVFEGTKVDLDLHYSPLTNASAMVFINGLANVEETKTITFKSTTYNTLTEEQIAVATSKGWTVISA